MAYYDVFNGDADGICALHQLRLAQPAASTLITGVKRDITLLDRVVAKAGDEVTVLDIALDKNRAALDALLDRGVRVGYFDHHYPGAIPEHANFAAHIDRAPDVCTSLLVDRFLQGKHRPWAVVGAFGDNLREAAVRAAAPLRLSPERLDTLRELGECLNYNAYGETVADLHYPPDELYRLVQPHADPFAFIAGEDVFRCLREGYAGDIEQARALRPEIATDICAVYVLPDAPWSRRVSGSFGNDLAQAWPQRAHAILTRRPDGYTVSVRASLAAPAGADELCLRFGGGGRKIAAGINLLPTDRLEEFVTQFRAVFTRG